MIPIPQEYESVIASLLRQGKYASAEEIIARAFEPLREEAGEKGGTSFHKKTPAEAVESIRKNRVGNTLGGLKIKDLINEGRP